jgi:DNA-binding response OmpR family regulator
MSQTKVLLIDDDEKIVKLLRSYFEKEGWIATAAYDGLQGLQAVKLQQPDIVILDLMLPGIDGWEVCKRLRKDSDVPIIMLTARDEETDRLIGLELGADDYVSKPFSPREVVARAKAVLRRTQREVVQSEPVKIGELKIDVENHEVRLAGQILDLTPTEFKILHLLAQKPGRPFTRLQIVEDSQGEAFDGYERTIDVHIKNLRRKLGDDGKEATYIQTVYGVGYKMVGSPRA